MYFYGDLIEGSLPSVVEARRRYGFYDGTQAVYFEEGPASIEPIEERANVSFDGSAFKLVQGTKQSLVSVSRLAADAADVAIPFLYKKADGSSMRVTLVSLVDDEAKRLTPVRLFVDSEQGAAELVPEAGATLTPVFATPSREWVLLASPEWFDANQPLEGAPRVMLHEALGRRDFMLRLEIELRDIAGVSGTISTELNYPFGAP